LRARELHRLHGVGLAPSADGIRWNLACIE